MTGTWQVATLRASRRRTVRSPAERPISELRRLADEPAIWSAPELDLLPEAQRQRRARVGTVDVMRWAATVGILALLLLMSFAFYNDIARILVE